MRLADSIQSVLILDDTGATNRDQAIKAILDQMSADGLFASSLVSELRASVIDRDELGPTGIGEGVAIPHVWHAGSPPDGRRAGGFPRRTRLSEPGWRAGPYHLADT